MFLSICSQRGRGAPLIQRRGWLAAWPAASGRSLGDPPEIPHFLAAGQQV